MKHLLLFLSVALLVLSCQEKRSSSVEGTWQMYKDGQPFVMQMSSVQMHRFKIINDETFVVIQTTSEDSLFAGYFAGDYQVDGNIYTENIRSAIPFYKNMIGKPMSFEFQIEDDIMRIKGVNNAFNETWKRVSLSKLEYLQVK